MRRINLARHGTGNEIDPGAERIKAMKGLAFDLDRNWKESRCYGNNRAAVVRGIRHHLSFAQGPIITALCTGEDAGKNLDFRRARNARLIMNNIIPSAKELGIDGTRDGEPPQDTSKLPHCIWHPVFASEETYRVLAAQYPLFRYPVGRARAAAGYDKLYFELGLLPDVSIAEEARESKAPGAKIIYDTVMASPARYTILDDRSMSVAHDASPFTAKPAFLNADTVVRRLIHYRPYRPGEVSKYEYNYGRSMYPSITEDRSIKLDPDTEFGLPPILTDEEVHLLHSPLPLDLPTMNKTLLTLMAAYHGEVDRYARLARRDVVINDREAATIVRGIHCNPLFAKFWQGELENDTDLAKWLVPFHFRAVQKAVSARRIMCGDWQEFEHGWDPNRPRPFLIWWPQKPDDATLSELCVLAPTMRETAVIAAIMCDYDDVFYSYKIVPPTQGVFLAAKFSKNPWYLEQVLADAREYGIEFDETDNLEHEDLQYIRQRPEEPMRNWEWPLYHQYDGVEFEDSCDLEHHNELEVGKVFHRLFSTKESREKIPLKRRN